MPGAVESQLNPLQTEGKKGYAVGWGCTRETPTYTGGRDPPPDAQCGRKKIIAETLSNVVQHY